MDDRSRTHVTEDLTRSGSFPLSAVTGARPPRVTTPPGSSTYRGKTSYPQRLAQPRTTRDHQQGNGAGAAGSAGRSSGADRVERGRFRRPRSRSAPTARPAWWDGVSHVVTRPARLDHLRAVGPLAFRWTTVFREPGGPTAFKWSKRTQVVQADRPRHDMRDAVPPCKTTGGGEAPEPLLPPPRPPRRLAR